MSTIKKIMHNGEEYNVGSGGTVTSRNLIDNCKLPRSQWVQRPSSATYALVTMCGKVGSGYGEGMAHQIYKNNTGEYCGSGAYLCNNGSCLCGYSNHASACFIYSFFGNVDQIIGTGGQGFIDLLLVGGGGSGNYIFQRKNDCSGGGGGGGGAVCYYSNLPISDKGNVCIVVGAGGPILTDYGQCGSGGASKAFGFTAGGGGSGQGRDEYNGITCGPCPGTGGYRGGNVTVNGGGYGASYAITGTTVEYGIGGTGGCGILEARSWIVGAARGGGCGSGQGYGCKGVTCGGGGGGGTLGYNGGAGAGGLVVIRYKTDGSSGIDCRSYGGCKYTCGEYTIHCFTSSGLFIPVYKE